MNLEAATVMEETFLPAPRALSDEDLDSVSGGVTPTVGVIIVVGPPAAAGAVATATTVLATGAAVLGAAAAVLAAINKQEKENTGSQ